MKNNNGKTTILTVFFFLSFILNGLSQVQSNEIRITEKIFFNGNASIDAYFGTIEGQDGLNLTKAYIMSDLKFSTYVDHSAISSLDGVLLEFYSTSRYIIIENCIFENIYKDTSAGVDPSFIINIRSSQNIIIRNCTFINKVGIDIDKGAYQTIEDNILDGGSINAGEVDNLTISRNKIGIIPNKPHSMKEYFQSRSGHIHVGVLTNSNISNNTISDTDIGLKVKSLTNCIVENNTLMRCKFDSDMLLSHTNTVNGKFFYYYKDKSGLTSDNFTNAGQAIIVNCEDSIISSIDAEYLDSGIIISYSKNITLENCSTKSSFNGGIVISTTSNLTIKNNEIFGWIQNPDSLSKNVQVYLNQISPYGIYIASAQNVYNINISRNVVIGCKYGIGIIDFYDDHQNIFNVTVYDNLYANNSVNGNLLSGDLSQYTQDGSIKFDNSTHGNYWEDYEAPRTVADMPSSSHNTHPTSSEADSLIWDAPYEVNGIVDTKPLKTYDHEFEYPDFTPLYPWEVSNPMLWIMSGIVGAIVLVGVAGMVFMKKRRTVI
jgi:parallel beta-helix repeat protein